MITITDYTGDNRKAYGPYKEVSFCCVTQSFPAVQNSTVTYSVIAPDDTRSTVTVSLVHVIETAEQKADRYDECVGIVFNATDPLQDITEAKAEQIISCLKKDGLDVPDMLTPSLFVEIYNDLEPDQEDE